MNPREVDALTLGELNVLFRDVLAEQGKPLPVLRKAGEFSDFAAVLADEWTKGRA
ncbi:MAG: hypothetical protein LCH38_10785 [Proteobacteria bacterium]|nr:hypothetical protein [Pseudomonadota bacterium]